MSELALVTWRLPQTDLPRLEEAREAVQTAVDRPGVFTLTTCQRALACTLSEDPRQAAGALAESLGAAGGERFTGVEAFGHLARVAASLEALVPGEDQVPAQFREALADQAEDLPDPLRERLDHVRAISREARDAGNLTGHASRSIVTLARPLLPENGPVAVVGTGSIGDEAVAELAQAQQVHVVSRTRERARKRASSAEHAWTRAAFLEDPPPLAGVVLATATDEGTVLPVEGARRIVAAAPSGEAVVVDLGVPRNADPAAHRVEGLSVHDLEDLAREARNRGTEDDRVRRARQALADAVAAHRRRRLAESRTKRVVALRDDLAAEIEALVAQLPDPEAEDQVQAWARQAHGRLAHASQRHLEAALEGETPP